MMMEKKDTRKLLVETAITLFRTKGVEAVSIKDICEEAKVTRNAFYYHFQTKEMLFDAIGDHLTEYAKEHIETLYEKHSAYHQIWEIYRPFLESQIFLGPDIMNHCNLSRTIKGHADNYMYIDQKMAATLSTLIDIAKKDQEIATTAETEDLVWGSYSIIRGNNIKWCYRWGETDLIKDAKNALNTLFLPLPPYRLV